MEIESIEKKNTSNEKDEESAGEKLSYPKSVFFIVTNEFCERFCYYGMRTILIIYLTKILLYNDADAKIIYHTFTMLVYFFPVFGAIISDSYLGKFRTILYVSMIYACGSILIAITAVESLGLPLREFTILGLLLIAVGTGGIKPCVSAFGGDQFVLPQQETQLAMFFSLFYLSINAGSLISTFLTPILRNDVQCFGAESCFPLAFAVPGILMVVSIAIFAMGRPLYKVKKPKGNVVVEVTKCISHAIAQKFKSREPANHWLDRSEEKFGTKMVQDVKSTLKVLVLYLPLPIFWALYDQQGSAWTIQAVRMNGDVGFYTILPDQMQVVNPLLIIGFIPLFTYIVYPLLSKCHLLRSPLQKMCAGGFLAAAAFVISALVAMALENTYPQLPSVGEMQLRVYDTTGCGYRFTSTDIGIQNQQIKGNLGYYQNKSINIIEAKNVTFTFTSTYSSCAERTTVFDVDESTAYGIFLNSTGAFNFTDELSKSEDGYPKIRVLSFRSKLLRFSHAEKSYSTSVQSGDINLVSMPYPGSYYIEQINGSKSVDVKLGGTYTVLVNTDNTVETFTITQPNSVHILWLLPQYFVITAAEIMFSITGLEFSYSQAPSSMKSVLQALWLLTTAFGNLIIVVIEAILHFDKQSTDFFVYASLMVVDMFVFMWLAIRYKYSEEETSEDDETERDGEIQELSRPRQKKLSNAFALVSEQWIVQEDEVGLRTGQDSEIYENIC